MGLTKILLYIFNVVFLLCGAACLGLGIWVKLDKTSLLTVTRLVQESINENTLNIPSLLESASMTLTIGGGIVFVIALLGCCGAWNNIKACLYLYSFFVIAILIAEMVAVVLCTVYLNQFETYAHDYLAEALQTRYIGPYATSDVISLAFDAMFISLSCCGVNNFTDFSRTSLWNKSYVDPITEVDVTAVMPLTCCIFNNTAAFPRDMDAFISSMADTGCPLTRAASNADTGCYAAAKAAITTYSQVSIRMTAAILILELLVIISSCSIIRDMTKEGAHYGPI